MQQVLMMADAANWRYTPLTAGRFTLGSFAPRAPVSAHTLTVYIEGDGFAWVTSSMPSNDPTPRDPVALKMALQQQTGAAAYLARPCQYIGAEKTQGCDKTLWTDRRFAPEVIDATSVALDTLKSQAHAARLVLVGYSGGGAVAALVAARRTDVDRLVTVAGNLDIAAWTELHAVHPLEGSLNPADEAARLAAIPQLHFVGGRDDVMPEAVARSYAARFPPAQQPAIRVIEYYTHACCWAENWRTLYVPSVK